MSEYETIDTAGKTSDSMCLPYAGIGLLLLLSFFKPFKISLFLNESKNKTKQNQTRMRLASNLPTKEYFVFISKDLLCTYTVNKILCEEYYVLKELEDRWGIVMNT